VIVHVILFSPRSDLPNASQRELIDALATAAASISSIARFRVGRRVRHGLPGYEHAMREDYSFAAIVEVEDLAGLKAYLRHPAHAAIGRHFTASASNALAYDYEMVEARDAARLADGW
jgi:hypothetical protein